MKYLKSILTACLLLCVVIVNAHDFEVDGIYYHITDATNKTVAITYRGRYDYAYDEYIGSVLIPGSVTYNGSTYSVTAIGDGAFYSCDGLTSIEIPNSVTSIGNGAFEGCFGLTCVEIPNSVTFIGEYAFYGCTGLTSVEFNAENCTSMGNYIYPVFSGCTALSTVIIGENVKTIPYYAFYNCDGLTNVVIGNGVTSIGCYAFQYCTGLTSVVIGNSVTSIGESAFDGCSGIKEVHINDLVAWCGIDFGDISANPLYYAKNLYLNGELVTELVIPDGVKEIKDVAFYNCSGLTSIDIPNSVTSIGEYAFKHCTGLTNVVIGNSVTSIGIEAFYNCIGLTSITIPNSVTSIGYWAFSSCTGLKEVHISDIAAWCGIDFGNGSANPLYYAKNLYLNGELVTELVIPEGVKDIKICAFCNCTGLTSVEIPNSVTYIGYSAFYGCTGLTSVVIPNSVTSIEIYAFYGCSGLTSIEIPNSVTSIGSGAFSGCSGLTSVVIPNSVTAIGESAFYSCDGLKTVYNLSNLTFSKGSSNNGYVAYYADKVYNLPEGFIENDFVLGKVNGVNTLVGYLGNAKELTLLADYKGENYVIGEKAFSGCIGLTRVEISDGVTIIGSSAFASCTGLTSIEIPGSVTDIRHRAFNDCTSLKELCIEDGEDVLVLGCNDVEKGLFYDCPLETLYLGRILSYEKSSEFGSSPFYGVETLASVGIGASGLDENLFAGCANINNLGFNTEVVPYIFANYASVTDVTLSGRVKTIADGAFVGMDNLANVVLETPVPPAISSDVFDRLHYKQLYVYLLDGCTPIYQASEIWKNFLDIQEYAPDGVGASVAANVWRDYWDIPEYTVPQGELEENLFADLSQLERVSDGVRLPNAKGVCVSVYTFGGSLIKNVSCYSGETIVLDKGAYIIVTDSNALKVVL